MLQRRHSVDNGKGCKCKGKEEVALSKHAIVGSGIIGALLSFFVALSKEFPGATFASFCQIGIAAESADPCMARFFPFQGTNCFLL